jgi:multidrug efflux pump subunit AcrA (membrane-fusion protein)
VAAPLQRSITEGDDYVGRFEAIEDVEILPRVSGNITHIAFREGLAVGKGQLLYEIDPRPFRAALAQAEAEVARARANAVVAQSELARAETLLPDEAISKEAYEQ